MLYLKSLIIVTSLALIAGCAAITETGGIDPVEPPESQTPELTEQPEIGAFEPETLYSLLVAEFAGQNERYDLLLSNYLNEAKKTRDPGIAAHTTRIATYLKANQAALTAAQIWVEVAPNSIKAKKALALQLIKAKQFTPAMVLLEETLKANQKGSFEYLALSTKGLPQSERNQILAEFNRLLKLYPENRQLLFGKTILLQLSGRLNEAVKSADQLHATQQDTQSLMLKAKMMYQAGRTKASLKFLSSYLMEDSGNKQVRLLYGQLLIDQKDLLKAEYEFAILAQQYPKDHQLRLTLALITLENKNFSLAKIHFQHLTTIKEMAEEAHYYLAQVAEAEENVELAISHYHQVSSGDKLVAAHSRIGHLLLEQDKVRLAQKLFEESRSKNPAQSKTLYMLEAELLSKYQLAEVAIALLNQALTVHPDDINLLYTRAMTSEKLNDLVGLEKDLRKILGIEPDNATVLNALGYTLADRTDRYQEALELISKANELKPNDPAITDSMGWAFFRLGNYQESIRLLEKALSEYPDHEVAAHLGEVLWITGQREKARQVWLKALEQKPDSTIIRRVMERLNPEQPSQ